MAGVSPPLYGCLRDLALASRASGGGSGPGLRPSRVSSRRRCRTLQLQTPVRTKRLYPTAAHRSGRSCESAGSDASMTQPEP